MSVYNKLFYDNQVNGSLDSARAIVPIVMNIANPKSVIDVGCGLGTWLSVFNELGVNDILGCDGDWVDQNQLLIHKDDFITTDLENPVEINRKFDLAISLEVAEHISKENAEKFIKYLTDKSSVILFSAAIPFQGGINHINEQWPEYWIKIFEKNNYHVIDCIRGKIWENNNIEFWYIQNIFLFVEKNYLQTNEKLQQLEANHIFPYSIVHPRVYSYKLKLHKDIENNLKKVFLDEQNSQKQNYENQIKKQKQIYENQIMAHEEMFQKLISSNSWKITKHPRKLGAWIKNLKKS